MPAPSVVRFYLVDVFTDTPLTGNPLAVVPGAADLPDDLLGRLAREFNQSETTFLYPPSLPGADWRLRSFTPAGIEVFGAGHNALGAWWWLAESGHLSLDRPVNRFRQQLGFAVLPVCVRAESGRPVAVGMEQERPTFGAVAKDHGVLAAALGLMPGDLREDLPSQVVSTGVGHLLVPVRRGALDRAKPQGPLVSLVQKLGGEGCYVFTLDTHHPAVAAEARFFSPGVGIAEDPATGTAAGPLAAYLVHHGKASGPEVVVHQGEATGRPSRLRLSVTAGGVELWGSAVITAEGTIAVS